MSLKLTIEKALQDVGLSMDVLVYVGIGAAILGVVARLIYHQLTLGPKQSLKGASKLKVESPQATQGSAKEKDKEEAKSNCLAACFGMGIHLFLSLLLWRRIPFILPADEPSESEGTVLKEENGQTVRRSTRTPKRPEILDGSELSSPQRGARTPGRTK